MYLELEKLIGCLEFNLLCEILKKPTSCRKLNLNNCNSYSQLIHSNFLTLVVNADDFVGGHYTEEEMNVALCILAVIMCVFFAVCSCQCYQKVAWECTEKYPYPSGGGMMPIGKRPMPCAPYHREGQV